jgi:hypothetical protein
MKNKSKSNQKKLKLPIIINNEKEDEEQKLVRPIPRSLKEIAELSNKSKITNSFKSNENKTYISEGSCSNSK